MRANDGRNVAKCKAFRHGKTEIIQSDVVYTD